MSYETATPRIAVYMLFEQAGKYAFVLRSNTGWRDGFYALPSGKVEKSESFTQAAIREAKEEVGVTIKAKDLHAVLTCHRMEDGNDWVDTLFVVDTWQGELVNNEPHMHSELTWFALDAMPVNVTPNQRITILAYLRGEHFYELGWDGADFS